MCREKRHPMKTVTVAVAFLLLVACAAPAPMEVEVTRLVEVTRAVEVEVTRAVRVEVEVTRVVPVPQTVEVEVPVTVVVAPSRTPTPRATATPTRSMADIQADVADAFVRDLEEFDDVERVNVVRFAPGRMEMELYTVWASQDSQPNVSWTIVTTLASALADLTPGQRINLTGSEELVFALTTYSTDGDFRYQSETDFATLEALASRSMSYEEWLAASGAGFR
jgi:hypothetical protein